MQGKLADVVSQVVNILRGINASVGRDEVQQRPERAHDE